jgi:hypothetical protein
VALSRVKSLDCLSILGLHSKAFAVHPEVLERDETFRQDCDKAKQKFEHLRANKQKREKAAAKASKSKSKTANPDQAARAATWAEKLAKMRETYPNAYRPWSETDDQNLTKLFQAGGTVKEMTKHFGRHPGAIRKRLEKLFGEEALGSEHI